MVSKDGGGTYDLCPPAAGQGKGNCFSKKFWLYYGLAACSSGLMTSRQVIVITDGDRVARKAVEEVARRVGGRCISASAGNPTPITGESLVTLIEQAAGEPVLVMLDDRGWVGTGPGEHVLEYLANHPAIDLLGVVAVASHTRLAEGVEVDGAVDRDGGWTKGAVNKEGEQIKGRRLKGDTVDILNQLKIPVIIGTGDTGKMDGQDAAGRGALITTRAVQEIIQRSKSHD